MMGLPKGKEKEPIQLRFLTLHLGLGGLSSLNKVSFYKGSVGLPYRGASV